MRLKDYMEQMAYLVAEEIEVQNKLNEQMIRRIDALEKAVKALAEKPFDPRVLP
jgi:hypothetical protein